MKSVVYTALFGEYEPLVEQPMAASSDCAFICFTDNAQLTSNTWTIHVVPRALPDDAARSVRQLKLCGHEILSDFDNSLWIDNRIVLKTRPEDLITSLLSASELGAFSHSGRATVEGEYLAVLRKHLDDPARVREQLAMMRRVSPTTLNSRPLWGAIIARRHSPHVERAMRVWMDQVLRYSRRDQLSFNYALDLTELPVNILHRPNRESEWHRWLTTGELPKDKRARYAKGFTYPLITHLWDVVVTNRVSRRIRWTFVKD